MRAIRQKVYKVYSFAGYEGYEESATTPGSQILIALTALIDFIALIALPPS